MKRISIIALVLFAAAAAAAAHAQPPQDGQQRNPQQDGQRRGPGQEGPRRGPPQEFIDACKGKKDGDTVEALSPRGDMVRGVCHMVMTPSNPPGDQSRQRPPAR